MDLIIAMIPYAEEMNIESLYNIVIPYLKVSNYSCLRLVEIITGQRSRIRSQRDVANRRLWTSFRVWHVFQFVSSETYNELQSVSASN
jgi:hypothetical protein